MSAYHSLYKLKLLHTQGDHEVKRLVMVAAFASRTAEAAARSTSAASGGGRLGLAGLRLRCCTVLPYEW